VAPITATFIARESRHVHVGVPGRVRATRLVLVGGAAVLVGVAATKTGLLGRLGRFVLARVSDRAWALPFMPALMRRGWERRTELFAAYDAQPGDVIMLGDSITEMTDWSALLPGVRVHNHGIGGDVTGGVLRRLDVVTRSAPGKVFLMIGTNDLGRGKRTVDEIVADVATIVERIRAESPTTQVHVQSVLPRLRRRADQVRAVNRGLEAIAREQDVEWIDLGPVFDRGDGQMRDELALDALHPNPEGYRRWIEVIEPLVRGASVSMGLGREL
jgi:hypothetical protein